MAEWLRIERARWEELDETARRLARISGDMKAQLDALRAERDELNETLGAHEDRLQQLRAELAEARKIGIALQRTVTEQSAMLDALSAEASKGADVADALRARVAQLEADPLVRDPQDWHNPDDLARIAELEAAGRAVMGCNDQVCAFAPNRCEAQCRADEMLRAALRASASAGAANTEVSK